MDHNDNLSLRHVLTVSVLEALSILQPMELNLAWFDLPAYAGDDETKSKKLLPKWLDGLASLLAGSSAGSRKDQVCAVSLSLSQSGCDLTIAFNWTLPHSENDARQAHQHHLGLAERCISSAAGGRRCTEESR